MKMLIGYLCVAFTLFSFPGCSEEDRSYHSPAEESGGNSIGIDEGEGTEVSEEFTRLTISSTVRDVLNHPAFRGFSRYVLPLEWRYDESMPLSRISSLLPYHNYVDGSRAVGYINDMIDRVALGETIYYGLARKDAGLFFFRGNPGAPFAVVCPGGGFSYVGSVHEGFPHAIELSKKGYNAFVIHYRTGGAQVACEDLAAGIAYIFDNKDSLKVSTAHYSVWGSSAGARMAAYMGSYGPGNFGVADFPRPGVVVMAYTGHSDYTPDDPPAYAVIGTNDAIASPAVMRRRAEHLQAAGIDAEFRLFPNLSHGFGLGIGTSAEGWLEDATRFWEEHR